MAYQRIAYNTEPTWIPPKMYSYPVFYLNIVFVITGFISSFTTDGFPASTSSPSPTERCSQVCLYEEFFRRAHCDQRSLSFVPSSAGCEDVLLLELQGNNITTIDAKEMSEFSHVGTLDISNNQIAALESGTFQNNPKLRNIIASHNELQVLQSGTFNGIENTLARIFLNNNELHKIEEKAFQGLRKVTVINLNNNRLRYLPSNVFKDLVDLTTLSLSNNSLLEIDRNCFKNLTRLRILHLHDNNLTKLPGGLLTGLQDLKEVNVSNNRLNIIPTPEGLGLHHLEVLDLTNNRLNQSMTVVPFLSNVTDLYFGGNPFTCDCTFKILQNWFYKTSDSQQSSLFTRSLLGCIADNGTFVAIQNNLTLRCMERETTTSPPVEMSSLARPFGGKTADPQLHGKQDEGGEKFTKDRDGRILRVEYKDSWITYYTAVVLTIYVIIRIVVWFVKTWKHSDTRKTDSRGHG